jgi:superfamily II DNA/RNA helicase
MTHHVFRVDAADKGRIVQELASGLGRTVLFTRTKHQAKKLAKQLTAAGVPAVDLHGNLSQNARERNLEAFSNGSTRVLCATDIAARGIHVDDVAIVVHVDPPAEHKAYLHRSGRTARAGAEGAVVTIATPDQAGEVRLLARQAGISPEVSAIKPGAREITALTGPSAPYVEPAPVVEAQPQGNGGGRRRSGGGGSGRGSAGGGASSGGRSSSGNAAKSGGAGRASGPARTRAELAARAGSSSAASFSSRSRRGSR